MLKRKLIRDMRAHKTQFISIFLMAFLAMFVYAGIGGEWSGLMDSSDTFYKETRLADGFIYGADFSKEDLEKIDNLSSVKIVERRLNLEAVADMENEPSVQLYFLENNTISKPYSVDGEDVDPDDKDGVWLDQRFADTRNIKIGDKMKFSFMNMEIEAEVRGLVYSPEYVFRTESEGMVPEFGKYGFAFLSDKAFPVKEMLAYNTIMIESDENDMIKVEEDVDRVLEGNYITFLAQKDMASVKTFRGEITQHKMMGDIFPVVFLLLALLTILTTMTRIVTNQRTQIGTLKALGFKKFGITMHYISYGFFLSFAGSALGIITGPLTLPYLFYPSMSEFYTLPQWQPSFRFSFILVGALLVAACTLVTFLACRKMLKDTPAETLRPAAPKIRKQRRIENTQLWNRLSFNVRWNLRDIGRNKSRSLMAIVGVFGCTALLSCAFGMNDGMEDLKSWQYDILTNYKTKIAIDENATAEEIEKILDDTVGEELMESTVEIKSQNNKQTGSLTVIDSNEMIHFTDAELNDVTLPDDGLSITEKTANLLDVKVGDVIKWHIIGEEGWKTSEVAKIYREPLYQGITVSKDYLEDKGYKYKATSILTNEILTGIPDGSSSVSSLKDVQNGWDELTESMVLMTYVLIFAAVLLAIVVLYNLGLLSFTEKERDIATLKVLGMKTGKLRNLLLTQNIWFAVIGYIAGIPVGLRMVWLMVESSGEAFDFPVTLHWTNALYSFLITFGLSILTNLMFSGKIKNIDMVEALKASE